MIKRLNHSMLAAFGIFFLLHLNLLIQKLLLIYVAGEKSKLLNWSDDFKDILKAIWAGFAYEGRVVGFIASFCFLIILFGLSRFKYLMNAILLFFFALINIICSAELVFYYIYQDTFNLMLFEFVNEDKLALIKTGLSESYGVLPATLLCIVLTTAFFMASKKLVIVTRERERE